MNLIHPPETELICDEIFRNRKNAKYFQAHCQVFAGSMYTFGTKTRLISNNCNAHIAQYLKKSSHSEK